MKILIVGAGALGSLVGGLLARAGATVQLYNPSQREHINAVRQAGLQIECLGGETLCIRLQATADPHEILQDPEIVGIFVKAHQTAIAISQIAAQIPPGAWVLSLQNGIGMESEILRYVSPERFLRGTTAQGATLLGPGRVRWAGVGPTRLGRWHGPPTTETDQLVALFNRAGLETEFVTEIERYLWEKLIVNGAINPLTALFDVPNGMIVSDPVLREIAHAVVREALPIARRHGVLWNESEMIERLETVACKTAQNISSMLQDVRRGRRTEIEYINGAIVREGRRLNLPTPVNLLLVKWMTSLDAKTKGANLP
ncbi:MAG: 2-dehydropantoate 2-reductase [Candidatus Bipolaricaulota bacterium]|nr:2-dehydropantoate 2-reductase [Candidatus Bipolaricaulota bacterium]MCS7274517.1 2-dehydropantoate 2-reductase [Candidatus Bipolaricaulota bacterium]MDW8111086.1 2-dehydropantoate 2-reductase [Candidatus Bipolaricaulota bacterium]MDW8329084.1 2-dehydropantoate 2-reductase [Candidatus Bipolaricaulota bacterium]